MANDLGLGLPYALQGLDQVLAQRKAEQIAAQQRAHQQQQQAFENNLKMRNEMRLEDVMKGQQADRQAGRDEQDFTRAGQINQALPEGSFLQQGDPAVGMMQKAGYGGFLKSAPAITAQGQDFQGPTENASIQDYQEGRPGGFVKSATAQQLAEQAKEKVAQQREQQVIDNQTTQDKRLQADQTERARHNRAMENKSAVPAVDQNKLEQQYRTALMRAVSSRSGGLGLEDQKVGQANHLTALLNQYEGKNMPNQVQAELALGLARLVSPTGIVGEHMMQEFNQRTAQGQMAGATAYLTGDPQYANATPEALRNMLSDSIQRQGQTAVQNREGYMNYIRGLAPTDLEESRRTALEGHGLVPLAERVKAAAAPATKMSATNKATGEKMFSDDGGKTWHK